MTKTTTFALLHFSVGFGVTYWLTSSVAIATGVALIEPAVNTVVFFLSDNGPWGDRDDAGSAFPLRGGKLSPWEGGIRVPCIVRAPGLVPPGSVRPGIENRMFWRTRESSGTREKVTACAPGIVSRRA